MAPVARADAVSIVAIVSPPPSIHAVFSVLNDSEFFGASLRSVYDHVSGVTVVTRYDRDRYGRARVPDDLVGMVLSRRFDPDRKVNLIVTSEGSEPRARNRTMAFAATSSRVVSIPEEPPGISPPDLFWHIDADEVYDDADIARLLDWVGEHRAQAYLLELRTYFRSWNWRVAERGSFVALTRPGFRFGAIRNWYPTPWARGWAKLAREGHISESLALRPLRARLVPPSVAVCHHGSYVGPRSRIEQKLASSSHRDQMVDGWLDRVWDTWTPESCNFHPTHPDRFPVAEHVETAQLPRAIREQEWPDGWIERPTSTDAGPLPVDNVVADRTA